MGDDKCDGARMSGRDRLVTQLAMETGITADQARGLISMLGTDRNSLLREARIIFRQGHRQE
ncbi:hypothetical protein EN925_20255 [Mesorhizobium sp. M7A.F.Ca.US.006.04.2.1]|nr:hypothetical protein EN990_21025 [Mesorhizobium sp. M7A.F.Ca.US.005.03.1.1]RUY16246.1 hypothetical protein EN991_12030 [Mesorhizobium sp. M7A.F.Ca.US.005.03.2.1]RVA88140.1 hypothetical protein EN925_20255 [Mesorhizobium sp. M7A.F.Ca.US.006.04.2.1]